MSTMSHINLDLRNQKSRPWWRPERSIDMQKEESQLPFLASNDGRSLTWDPWKCKQGLLFSSSHEANNVPLTQTFPYLLIESPANVNGFQKTPSTILAMLALPFPKFLLFHSTQHECGIFLDLFYLCIHLASGTKLLNPSLGLYYNLLILLYSQQIFIAPLHGV